MNNPVIKGEIGQSLYVIDNSYAVEIIDGKEVPIRFRKSLYNRKVTVISEPFKRNPDARYADEIHEFVKVSFEGSEYIVLNTFTQFPKRKEQFFIPFFDYLHYQNILKTDIIAAPWVVSGRPPKQEHQYPVMQFEAKDIHVTLKDGSEIIIPTFSNRKLLVEKIPEPESSVGSPYLNTYSPKPDYKALAEKGNFNKKLLEAIGRTKIEKLLNP